MGHVYVPLRLSDSESRRFSSLSRGVRRSSFRCPLKQIPQDFTDSISEAHELYPPDFLGIF